LEEDIIGIVKIKRLSLKEFGIKFSIILILIEFLIKLFDKSCQKKFFGLVESCEKPNVTPLKVRK
jgi:hypothetical protein